jgi:hypothetical protein
MSGHALADSIELGLESSVCDVGRFIEWSPVTAYITGAI